MSEASLSDAFIEYFLSPEILAAGSGPLFFPFIKSPAFSSYVHAHSSHDGVAMLRRIMTRVYDAVSALANPWECASRRRHVYAIDCHFMNYLMMVDVYRNGGSYSLQYWLAHMDQPLVVRHYPIRLRDVMDGTISRSHFRALAANPNISRSLVHWLASAGITSFHWRHQKTVDKLSLARQLIYRWRYGSTGQYHHGADHLTNYEIEIELRTANEFGQPLPSLRTLRDYHYPPHICVIPIPRRSRLDDVLHETRRSGLQICWSYGDFLMRRFDTRQWREFVELHPQPRANAQGFAHESAALVCCDTVDALYETFGCNILLLFNPHIDSGKMARKLWGRNSLYELMDKLVRQRTTPTAHDWRTGRVEKFYLPQETGTWLWQNESSKLKRRLAARFIRPSPCKMSPAIDNYVRTVTRELLVADVFALIVMYCDDYISLQL